MVDKSVIGRKLSLVEEHLRRIKVLPVLTIEDFKKDTTVQDILLFNLTQAIQNCVDIATHNNQRWSLGYFRDPEWDTLEHPEIAEKIPLNAQIVLLPEDDPELCRINIELAEQQKEEEQQVVYVHIGSLSPRVSRLKKVSLEVKVAWYMKAL